MRENHVATNRSTASTAGPPADVILGSMTAMTSGGYWR
jgi:hypothetical protein